MFKLVIVEDEDNIRHSLECFIPWNQMGFEVVGTFSDGSDALAYLQENPCDAVLTDILMSRMSGLELICHLHKCCPQTKVVILSGHSDFAYAQQAIAYHVEHYLVKPVDEEELMNVFMGIKEQLDCRQEELADSDTENRELKQLLQKGFFRDLLSGRVASDKELSEYLKLLGFDRVKGNCPLLAYALAADGAVQDEPEGNPAEHTLGQWLLADDSVSTFATEEKQDRWRIVFIGASDTKTEQLRKYSNQRLQTLTQALSADTGREYTFSLTHSVNQIDDLLADVGNAQTDVAQEPDTQQTLCQDVVSQYRLLVMELDLGCKDTLVHILDSLAFALKDVPLEDAIFCFKNLYSVIELEYKKRKINVWELTNGKFDFNQLYWAKSLQSLSSYVKECFCFLCDSLKYKLHGTDHTIVGRLVEYLNTHLDEDVGHEIIAKKYRIHPGYLSRLFKQEMGETLSEYMLRIRVEKAAGLLKQGQHKIGEIAGMVGYSTSSYFSIMFKKYAGCSPREYSQRISLR